MSKMKLEFIKNTANEGEGLNDPGIETYTDDLYACTARECGQNSADARSKHPVIMHFDRVKVFKDDLNAFSKLLATIETCLSESRDEKNSKAKEFFSHAKKLLTEPEIYSLKISDFNTHGVSGPCEDGKPFHSLVKAKGRSVKDSDTSGGSFGIGKYAAYAISELRTVFYSTVYLDKENKEHFLMQGKSILKSHIDTEGTSRLATGYWGEKKYSPIDDQEDAPLWLKRSEPGTTIVSLGFRDTKNWAYRMSASLILNFFVAIHRKEMVFKLDDEKIVIDSESLPVFFKDEKIKKAAEDANQLEDLNYSCSLYECLTAEESKESQLEIDGLGKISVRVLVKDDLPKRMSIIRNGMVITDTLEKFNDKFNRFPLYRDFVAIVEPIDDSSRNLIKRLENPKHNGLSAERITDEKKRDSASKAMKKLAEVIRNTIRSEAVSIPEKIQALDEMAQYFADEGDIEKIPDSNLEDDLESYTYEPKERTPKKPPVPKTRGIGEEGGFKGSGEGGGGDEGTGDGEGKGSGNDGKGNSLSRRRIQLKNIRNIISEKDESYKRTIWFTSPEKGEVSLACYASGLNSRDQLGIVRASSGIIADRVLRINCNSDERNRIDLTFDEKYMGPIELVGYLAIEEETNAN